MKGKVKQKQVIHLKVNIEEAQMLYQALGEIEYLQPSEKGRLQDRLHSQFSVLVDIAHANKSKEKNA